MRLFGSLWLPAAARLTVGGTHFLSEILVPQSLVDTIPSLFYSKYFLVEVRRP